MPCYGRREVIVIKCEKEFLYVGHYVDVKGRYILKVGTTNNLKRRAQEHSRNYRRIREYTLPPDGEFTYDWYLPLSKWNTLRYESKTRESWKELGIGTFVPNDRFYCQNVPDTITVTIRKTYTIQLKAKKSSSAN